jgi:hypothetical protein
MSRKDYRAFASAIKSLKEGGEAGFTPSLSLIAETLAGVFSQDNPAFDREKFLEACGV